MPLIFKRTPGSTVGYAWTDPDQGVEVEDRALAYELLHMDADFYELAPDADGAGNQAEEVPMPPKTGPGSGAKAWAAFAASKGVPVPDGATRDQVIEALETAGILTAAEGAEIEESPSEDDAADGAGNQAEEVPMPPKTGPGSGAKAWAAFAASKGVPVPDGATRDQVIEALETAGILTAAEGAEIEESPSEDDAADGAGNQAEEGATETGSSGTPQS